MGGNTSPPYVAPQHAWQPGAFGKCVKRGGVGGVRACGKMRDDTVHRSYPCPHDLCPEKFLSIEARDMHHAQEHGDGW